MARISLLGRNWTATTDELNFGVRRDPALRCAQRAEQCVSELRNRPQYREQRRGRALLLFLLTPDPHRRNQPRRMPAVSKPVLRFIGPEPSHRAAATQTAGRDYRTGTGSLPDRS